MELVVGRLAVVWKGVLLSRNGEVDPMLGRRQGCVIWWNQSRGSAKTPVRQAFSKSRWCYKNFV